MFKYKNIFLLSFILIASILFRFIFINQVPHSVNNDELHYLLSAKSLHLSGKDISQTKTLGQILMFDYPKREGVQAELPYILEMLSVGGPNFSLQGNALPNVILGILTVMIMYFLTKELFHNEKIALLSSLISAINPWFIFMSRTSYEVIPATFFFLTAFYLIVKEKSWKILWSVPLLILAFYSYIGTKLIFLPVILVFCIYSYFFIHKRKYLRQYLIILAISFAITVFFLFQLKQYPNTSRLNEILTPSSAIISDQVNIFRKKTIYSPLQALTVNKITIFAKIISSSLFAVFSPDYLFLTGDNFSSLYQHGIFYTIEILFLSLGCFALYKNNKRLLFFLLSVILISTLPQIIHNNPDGKNFTPHISLLIPFFIMIISYGVFELYSLFKGARKIYFLIFISAVYIFSVLNMLNIYFFYLPLQPNFFNFPDRVLNKYLSLQQKDSNNQKIDVYVENPKNEFEEYIFYNNLLNKNNVDLIALKMEKNDYKFNGVNFINCDNQVVSNDGKKLTIVQAECGMPFVKNYPTIKIPQITDNGTVYSILNDKMCSKFPIKSYISDFKINDFNLEDMSQENFCLKLLSR